MKLAVLSDAHGNSLALKLCIDYITEVYKTDKIFFLGDAVGYFPDYTGVIDFLQNSNIISLSGNHEAMLLGHMKIDKEKDLVYGISKNKKQLTDSHYSFLKGFRPFYELKLNKHILFTHGSPYNPLNGYIYPDTDISDLAFLPYDLIFMGHTHYPFIRKVGDKIIVNVGSCGLPRDEGSLLSFAVYDTESNEVEILRKYLNPKDVITFYGENELNASIISCLYRKSKKAVIGRVIV